MAHIVLDFDGTCTQIPSIFEAYLDLYCKGLNELGLNVRLSEWRDAQEAVRQHSPKAGWTVAECPSAPAAGDPSWLISRQAHTAAAAHKDVRSAQSTQARSAAAKMSGRIPLPSIDTHPFFDIA
jgi:hypothetical protein